MAGEIGYLSYKGAKPLAYSKDPTYNPQGQTNVNSGYDFQNPDGSITHADYHAPSTFDKVFQALAISAVAAGFGAGALNLVAPEFAASLGIASGAGPLSGGATGGLAAPIAAQGGGISLGGAAAGAAPAAAAGGAAPIAAVPSAASTAAGLSLPSSASVLAGAAPTAVLPEAAAAGGAAIPAAAGLGAGGAGGAAAIPAATGVGAPIASVPLAAQTASGLALPTSAEVLAGATPVATEGALSGLAPYIAPAISAGGSVLGSIITSNANSDAAKRTAEANAQAAQIANAAIDKQIAAMRQGVGEADQYYSQTQQAARPGLNYLQNVIATPGSLTPEQQAEREDLIRRVTNSSQVAGSALRGSGRSFVDALRAIEGDYTNKALAINKARADQAASQFTQPYFNSLGNEAAAHASLGANTGTAIAGQGQNTANALLGTTNAQNQASQANSNLWGSTIGQVGSEIASAIKNDNTGRTSTYNPALDKAVYDPLTQSYSPGTGGF